MKKIVFLALFSLVTISFVFSQSDKVFRFGLMGTPNIAWVKPNTETHDYNGISFRLGYGLTSEFLLGSNYSLSTGIESNYSGGKMTWENKMTDPEDAVEKNVDINATYRFQYLEIPLALKMKTNEINYLTYFARFGGALGMRLNSRADYEYELGGKKITDNDRKVDKDINFFRIAFVVGVGAEYSLGGTTSAFVSVNFNNGLTNIFRNKGDNLYDKNEKKGINNYFSLNAGILF